MPCRDYQAEFDRSHDDARTIRELQARNDKLAQLLCEAGRCRRVPAQPSKELLQWWHEHIEFDKREGRIQHHAKPIS